MTLASRLDGAIASVFPSWGLQRRLARARMGLLAAHDAAKIDRMTSDWDRQGYSADQANLPELFDVTARARASVRNDWAGASAVGAFERNVPGTGITPRAQARGANGQLLKTVNRKADRWFRRWARNPRLVDAEGRKSFNAMMRLAVRERVTTGQAFLVLGYEKRPHQVGLMLQMFEVEQLACEQDTVGGLPPKGRNQIRGGIEIDNRGRPVAYWVHTGSHPYERSWSQAFAKPVRIPAERVLHFGPQGRPRETLALSRLTPVLRPMWDRQGYEANELAAKKIEAFIALVIQRNSKWSDSGPIGFADESGTTASTGDSPDAGGNRQINFQQGTVPVLYEGEEIKPLHFDRPGSNYDAYMGRQTNSIAAGAGISGSRLNRKVSSSYSAGRQEDLEDNKAFDIDQQDLIDNLIRPIWERFFSLLVIEGHISLPGFLTNPERRADYLEAEFQTPPRPPSDPAKAAAALKILTDYGYANHAEELAKLGRDWRDNADTIAEVMQVYRGLGIPMPWLNPKGTPSDPKVHGTGSDKAGPGQAPRTQSRGGLAQAIIEWALREDPELAAAAGAYDEDE